MPVVKCSSVLSLALTVGVFLLRRYAYRFHQPHYSLFPVSHLLLRSLTYSYVVALILFLAMLVVSSYLTLILHHFVPSSFRGIPTEGMEEWNGGSR